MSTMHWSTKLAHEIIAARPNEKVYTIASGITPSGMVHIGNFREFFTTYRVGVELQKLGKKVRMVFSWDDFDPFRKVPGNIPKELGYEKYLKMSISDIPDPFGNTESYARHFQNEFEQAIKDMGLNEIPIQFIYQHKEYKSGRYDKLIAHAEKHSRDIYDILMKFKTQESSDTDRDKYSPVAILGGHKKLAWKIDWPMRWHAENVVFEPAGPDHMTSGGSYDVSSEIARKIFKQQPPIPTAYGFVGIKGLGVKMSSSKGNAVTPATLIKIYEPRIIRWLFEKYQPRDFFEFGFDDTIVRHYYEHDKETNTVAVNFGTLATVGPIVNFDAELVRKFLKLDAKTDLSRLERVRYWLENYAPEKIYKLRDNFNTEFYKTLSKTEQGTLLKLHEYLSGGAREESEIQQFLYDIINDPALEKKQNVEIQKRYFKIFYNMLFGRDDGPRLYLYLAAAPRESVLKLVKP